MLRPLGSLACAVACLPGTLSAVQLMVNGSFDDGLTGWTSQGAVSESSGFALIEEAGVGGTSAVFQSVAVSPDPLVLTFELYIGGMSTTVPAGLLADTVFGTIYFGDAAFGNDATSGTFDEQLSLFDLDRDGVREVAPGASREPIPGRTDWERFRVTFSTSRQFATIVVESIDLNGGAAPASVVAVDQFSLELVPEPSVLALLLPGLLLVFRRARAP